MEQTRRAALLGAGAYGLWGLFPLFWPLLEPSGALEVLAHRIVWSLVVVALLLGALHRWGDVRVVVQDRRRLGRLALAAVLIAVNWGTYIYGVNSEQVVETSLGYFVNPLVTVLLGVLVLGERLRPVQWGALALAALAVVVLTVETGHLPVLALVLAGSFGSYGLLKKTAGVRAVEGLAVEAAALTPVALGYLLVLGARSGGTFTSAGTGHLLLLVSSGAVTVGPLLMFGAAAQRVTMVTLGLLQYLTPTMQLAVGVLVRHEPLGAARLLGFALVWAALAVFSYDLVRTARRGARRRLVPEPA